MALADGAESLQDRVRGQLPQFTLLVLDIIHVSEYLWDAANALLGETHPHRTAWVGEQLLQILSGQTTAVIQTLESLAQDPSLSLVQRQTLNTTIGYYQHNLPYMHYDQYLPQGWPIGTGVVACPGQGRCLWAPRQGPYGAVWHALAPTGLSGYPRPTHCSRQ